MPLLRVPNWLDESFAENVKYTTIDAAKCMVLSSTCATTARSESATRHSNRLQKLCASGVPAVSCGLVAFTADKFRPSLTLPNYGQIRNGSTTNRQSICSLTTTPIAIRPDLLSLWFPFLGLSSIAFRSS